MIVVKTPSGESTRKKHSWKSVACGVWAMVSGVCTCGLNHQYGKRILCGREWCPDCGKKRSAAHNRRIARILPKVEQIKTMGYFVIEFPRWYRMQGMGGIDGDAGAGYGWCYCKRDLNESSRIIMEVLAGKRTAKSRRTGGYFKRGLFRWHWFGDTPGKWNPHVNVLVDSGYIGKARLNEIRNALRSALGVPELIVHYEFADRAGQKFHLAEYITRATFLNYDWDPYMANELYNFRNQRWWGKWNDAPAWSLSDIDGERPETLEAIVQLSEGISPDCGTPLMPIGHKGIGEKRTAVYWSKPVDSAYLIIWGASEIGDSGYYRIPPDDGGYLSPRNMPGVHVIIREPDRKKERGP